MNALSIPSDDNHYLAAHIGLIRHSYRHWTGRDLTPPRMTDTDAARYLFTAPLALLSHDNQPDPIFNYANRTALDLFGMTWEEMTGCPSRLSAEQDTQPERSRLLEEVRERGYSEGYRGVRIGRHGRRFLIEQATVWNLRDDRGRHCGQAASFRHWTWL